MSRKSFGNMCRNQCVSPSQITHVSQQCKHAYMYFVCTEVADNYYYVVIFASKDLYICPRFLPTYVYLNIEYSFEILFQYDLSCCRITILQWLYQSNIFENFEVGLLSCQTRVCDCAPWDHVTKRMSHGGFSSISFSGTTGCSVCRPVSSPKRQQRLG